MIKSKKTENKPTIGIVILCPALKIKDLELTLSWIQSSSNTVAILPPTKDKLIHSSFASICTTYKSKTESRLSMINKGMKHTLSDWNLILKSGIKMRTDVMSRLTLFAKKETDILFKVSPGISNFVDDPLDWLFIHKDAFSKVGNFSETLPIEDAKTLWATMASEAGCTLKGLAGLKLA